MVALELNLPGRRISFPIENEGKPITVGSHPDNDVCLSFRGVSRHHFSLQRTEGKWILRDVNSKNGTFVNGTKMKETPLAVGDTIQVGILELIVREKPRSGSDVISLPRIILSEKDSVITDQTSLEEKSDTDPLHLFPHLVFPEEAILSRSDMMLDVYRQLDAVAGSDASVLLVGETGAGKEIIAKTLHLSGKQPQGPFIPVNCAAIPGELAESELFGIGKRVATEVDERTGKMEEADGGTLFLDEISSIPGALQAKILRALDERIIHPVGKKEPVKVNFRLLAATNREPHRLVEAGALREDLYHRIAAVEIMIPPLRERREDIAPLAMALLKRACVKEKKTLGGISRKALFHLEAHPFPGNVRELINILHSMVLLAYPGETLGESHLPQKVLRHPVMESVRKHVDLAKEQPSIRYKDVIDDVSRELITHALNVHHGNFSRASAHLGMSHYGFRKAMKRLGVHPKNDV